MQLEITIVNWEKYNPKRDQKTYTWFKIQNNLPFSVSIEGLDFKDRWVFICLLCEASRKNNATFSTSLDILSRVTGVNNNELLVSLEKIAKNSIISSVSLTRQHDVVDTTPRIDKNRIEKSRVCSEQTLDAANLPTEIMHDPVVMEFLNKAEIKTSSVSLWLRTYNHDAAWLKLELLKILGWLDANPQKRPKKNYARFIGSWLSRGWERYRTTLPSNKPLLKTEEIDIWKQS